MTRTNPWGRPLNTAEAQKAKTQSATGWDKPPAPKPWRRPVNPYEERQREQEREGYAEAEKREARPVERR